MKQKFEVIVIGKQKEVCYLLQKKDSDSSEIKRKKEALSRRGYLVVTIIEGNRAMENGLRDVVRNHFRWPATTLCDPAYMVNIGRKQDKEDDFYDDSNPYSHNDRRLCPSLQRR